MLEGLITHRTGKVRIATQVRGEVRKPRVLGDPYIVKPEVIDLLYRSGSISMGGNTSSSASIAGVQVRDAAMSTAGKICTWSAL